VPEVALSVTRRLEPVQVLMRCYFRREAGFTLLELLVVIAIVAILTALLLRFLNTAKDKAKRTVCPNNLRQISGAIRMYCDDASDNSPQLQCRWVAYKSSFRATLALAARRQRHSALCLPCRFILLQFYGR